MNRSHILFSIPLVIEEKASVMNVEDVGDDDSHSFKDRKIPVISLHSVTRETFRILHSSRDRLEAIDADRYYSAYRLTAFYLAFRNFKLAEVAKAAAP